MPLGIFEQFDDSPPEPFLPDAVQLWAGDLMLKFNARTEATTEGRIITYGVDPEDTTALALFIGLEVDLSDQETFPESINGVRIVYRRLPAPKDQSGETA